MISAPVLVIKVNNNSVCSSNAQCTYDTSLNEIFMTISGHMANCQPLPVLEITYNGEDIAGQLELVHDSQGYCQASIYQDVRFIEGFSVLFTVVDNGKKYDLAYMETGMFMLELLLKLFGLWQVMCVWSFSLFFLRYAPHPQSTHFIPSF